MIRNYSRTQRNVLLATTALFTGLILLFLFRSRQTAASQLHVPWSYTNLYGHSPPTADYEEQDICKAHGYKQFQHSDRENGKRKVFDLFLFSSELDWLEIRLNTLSSQVDYFVIVESTTTFTGSQKPLHLKENWARFSEFHEKIIHKIIEDPGPEIGTQTWDHEDFFRNSLFYSAFPMELASEGVDVILVSDVDEIPKPATVEVLKHCDFPERLTLQSAFYYYSFQWAHVGAQWAHPQATTFRGRDGTISPNSLRNGIGGSWWRRWWESGTMRDAGWHCSSCFATLEAMKGKMASFSHTPLNTEANRDEKTIVERVRTGQDLFGRAGEKYARVDDNKDVPEYVLHRPDMFGYLLDRDGDDAGFSDWQV